MNFLELTNAVLENTKRTDKLTLIRTEINNALSFFVTDINGNRDSQEQVVNINATEFTQEFALNILTRFRKFRYIKYGGTKVFLKQIGVKEVADGCANMTNRYYIMGNVVRISQDRLAATLDVCYYQYPPVLAANTDTHWLTDSYPQVVVDRACYKIYASIGDREEAARFKSSSDETWRAKRMDLEAEGDY